jgi:hypothetical protein
VVRTERCLVRSDYRFPAKITEFAIETHYSPLPKRVNIDISITNTTLISAYVFSSEMERKSFHLAFASHPKHATDRFAQACLRFAMRKFKGGRALAQLKEL